MKNPSIHLRDIKPDLVEAWKAAFADVPEVTISQGDIFANTSADALVSPAQSFGYMDGGIDMVYSRHFGWSLSEDLRKQIDAKWDGELLVGQAAVVDIRPHKPDTKFKYLISAPTMRVPENVSQTANAYLAFRAVLRVATRHPDIKSIMCPGLGTAIGMMDSHVCARQMRAAFNEVDDGMWAPAVYSSLAEACRFHWYL